MDKIEMYFGLNRDDGMEITDREFSNFLEKVVTPYFPDGLTVVDGFGQWKSPGSSGIIKENCKILTLIVNSWHNAGIQSKVYDIRNSYCSIYNQESVLVIVSSLYEVSF